MIKYRNIRKLAKENGFTMALGHHFYALRLYKRGDIDLKIYLRSLNSLLFKTTLIRWIWAQDYKGSYNKLVATGYMFKRITEDIYEKDKDRLDALVTLMYMSVADFTGNVDLECVSGQYYTSIGNMHIIFSSNVKYFKEFKYQPLLLYESQNIIRFKYTMDIGTEIKNKPEYITVGCGDIDIGGLIYSNIKVRMYQTKKELFRNLTLSTW
ncbi:MAG: hypothetical protein K2P14_03185 [Anaeroplasmataceae bacterium]|nr:hypothetical protein [Anaeroplasmataceae bacterium]